MRRLLLSLIVAALAVSPVWAGEKLAASNVRLIADYSGKFTPSKFPNARFTKLEQAKKFLPAEVMGAIAGKIDFKKEDLICFCYRADGSDADFRVEKRGGETTVVFFDRKGGKGGVYVGPTAQKLFAVSKDANWVSTVKTFPRKKTDYPAPIQAVDKAPADRPKAEKVPGKLKLNGAWEVQLTEAQRRQYDYPTISMFRAKAFVFTDDVPEIRAAAKGVPYLQSFRVILDESVKPVRLTLVAERAGVRVHFRTQYMLNVWPCAVERINEDNIRIAFKRSGFLSKKLGTYNSRGPARPPMPRRGGGGFKPSKGVVPAARVEKALNGVTVNYPEKITWFGDLKGDLVVIPLRRAKPKVEDKKTEDKKAEKPPVKDSEHVVQCVVESATLEHRKCLCRVRGCKRVIPYYKIVLTDKAAKKTYTVNTSWNFNLEKGELVDFNPKTTKIHKEGKQHPYYTKQGRRAQR